MMRKNTEDKWKAIVEGYNPEHGTIKDYCAGLGIRESKYYKYRRMLSQKPEEQSIAVIPLSIEEETILQISVNGVPIACDPERISDDQLKRIMRLCLEL